MSLRVAILGHVPPDLRQHVADLVDSMDFTLIGPVTEPAAALVALSSPPVEIAIVATMTSDGLGFPFIRALPQSERPPSLIFIGDRDEDAVAAFELQATDFVSWPCPLRRITEALARARQEILRLALLRTATDLQRLIGEVRGSFCSGADVDGSLADSLRAAGAGTPLQGSIAPLARVPWNGAGGKDGEHAGLAITRGSVVTSEANAGPRDPAANAPGMVGANGQSRTLHSGNATLVPARRRSAYSRSQDARLGPDGRAVVLDLSHEDGSQREGRSEQPLRMLVREGRRTRFITLADVDWFEADGNYIRLRAGEHVYRTRGTISAIEKALDPRQFVRIHRRMVINMDRVRELSPLPGGDGLLTLGDGTTVRLSRTYRSRVR